MTSRSGDHLGTSTVSAVDNSYVSLIRRVVESLGGAGFWPHYLAETHPDAVPSFGLHVGIFIEPFLQLVLDGKKTVESRFSARRFAPYERVETGDVLLLKKAGGPIVGLCRVSDVWFYELDPASWQTIRTEFSASLCAQDPAFWTAREGAAFATLMRVGNVQRLAAPLPFPKRDRRGWVQLHQAAPPQGQPPVS